MLTQGMVGAIKKGNRGCCVKRTQSLLVEYCIHSLDIITTGLAKHYTDFPSCSQGIECMN